MKIVSIPVQMSEIIAAPHAAAIETQSDSACADVLPAESGRHPRPPEVLPSEGGIPSTGGPSSDLVPAALVMIAAGALLVIVAAPAMRKKREEVFVED